MTSSPVTAGGKLVAHSRQRKRRRSPPGGDHCSAIGRHFSSALSLHRILLTVVEYDGCFDIVRKLNCAHRPAVAGQRGPCMRAWRAAPGPLGPWARTWAPGGHGVLELLQPVRALAAKAARARQKPVHLLSRKRNRQPVNCHPAAPPGKDAAYGKCTPHTPSLSAGGGLTLAEMCFGINLE